MCSSMGTRLRMPQFCMDQLCSPPRNHKVELADWGRFGRIRERWEKYLKGEDEKEAH
jgi:hypothetical protein